MKKMKQMKGIGVILAVAVVMLLVIILIVRSSNGTKYNGLITQVDVEFQEGDRELLEQRIALGQETINRQRRRGEEIDLNVLFSVARDATTLGDLVLARETYEDYFQENSINPAAWQNYVAVLDQMQDYEAAEDAAKQMLDLQTTEAGVMRLVRIIEKQNIDGSRDEDIRLVLESGMDILDRTPALTVLLGRWHQDQGDCDQALALFEVAKDLREVELTEAGASADEIDQALQAFNDDIASVESQCQQSE